MLSKTVMDYFHQGLTLEEAVEAASIEDRYKKSFLFSSSNEVVKKYTKKPSVKKAKKALNENILFVRGSFSCTDHLGNVYKSKRAMCKAYGISIATYERRIKKYYSLERVLTGK